MASETKTKDPDVLTSDIERELEFVQAAPTKPVDRYTNFKHGGKTYEYYKSIAWDEWWDEYNTKQDVSTGRLKYRTINQFIQAKAKVEWQRELLWEMIGPEPKLKGDRQQLRVPYLGDWEKRRTNGFWCFEDHGKVRMVQEAIREKQEGLQATRAIAPLIASRMARWRRIAEVIDQRCQEILLSEKTVTDQEAKKLNFYIRMQEKAEAVLQELDNQWMRVFGVNPQDPGVQLLNMAALTGKVAAAAALTGAVAAGGDLNKGNGRATLIQDGQEFELPQNVTRESLMLADFLKAHAETYNLPLPQDAQKTQKSKTNKTQ